LILLFSLYSQDLVSLSDALLTRTTYQGQRSRRVREVLSQETRHRLSTLSSALTRSSPLYSGSLTLIVVDFHLRLLTYDEWQTLLSQPAAKIHHHHPSAKSGRHDLSSASQSSRQSGTGNSTYNVPAVRTLSRSSYGLSLYRTYASRTGYLIAIYTTLIRRAL
jgi:hypothetical protein